MFPLSREQYFSRYFYICPAKSKSLKFKIQNEKLNLPLLERTIDIFTQISSTSKFRNMKFKMWNIMFALSKENDISILPPRYFHSAQTKVFQPATFLNITLQCNFIIFLNMTLSLPNLEYSFIISKYRAQSCQMCRWSAH